MALASIGFGSWLIVEAVRGRLEPVGLLGLLVSGGSLCLDLLTWRNTSPPKPGERADELASKLAARSRREHWGRPGGSALLPLRWVLTDPAHPATEAAAEVRMRGDDQDLAAKLARAFEANPGRGLLILGEPGAGKSMVAALLQLGVLNGRRGDGSREPVPVLLPISLWNVRTESLTDFVIRSLAASYYSGQEAVPRVLMEADLLIPLLDGLDEVSEDARGNAAAAVNAYLAESRSAVVVTCRTTEYETLLRSSAPRLSPATSIRVLPVSDVDAISYLESAEWPAGTSWTRVIEEIRRASSPIAAAYSTPLMLSIARLAYGELGGDPSDQLKLESRLLVENALFDLAIDAAYSPRSRSRSRWRAVEARHYLSVLAVTLRDHREREIVWWRLPDRMLTIWSALAVGLITGVLLLAATTAWVSLARPGDLAGSLTAGALVGGATGVLATMIWNASRDHHPGRLPRSLSGVTHHLLHGIRVGVLLGAVLAVPVAVAVVISLSLVGAWSVAAVETFTRLSGTVVAGALAVGVALGVHRCCTAPPDQAQLVTPRSVLRDDRLSTAVGVPAAGVIVGALLIRLVAAGAATAGVLMSLITGGVGWPGGPRFAELYAARYGDLTTGLLGSDELVLGVVFILPGVVLTVLLALTRAWPRFQIMRMILAIRGDLPWRLLGFLEDAARRDLLRQSAGTFQFRHTRLQERLLDAEPGSRRPAAELRRRRILITVPVAAVAAVVLAVPVVALPHNTAFRTLRLVHGSGADGVVVSPRGDIMAVRSGGQVQLYRVPTGDAIRAVASTEDSGNAEFLSNGRLLLVDADPDRVVDVETGAVLAVAGPDQSVVTPGTSGYGLLTEKPNEDEKTLEVFDDKGAALGRIRGRLELRPDGIPENAERPVVLSEASDGVLRVWNATDLRRPIASLGRVGVAPDDVQMNRDGSRLLAASAAGTTLYDVTTGRPIAALNYHSDRTTMIQFDWDGRWIVAAGGGPGATARTLQVWDARTGTPTLNKVFPAALDYAAPDYAADNVVVAYPSGPIHHETLDIVSRSDGAVRRTVRNVINYTVYRGAEQNFLAVTRDASGDADERRYRLTVVDLASGAITADLDGAAEFGNAGSVDDHLSSSRDGLYLISPGRNQPLWNVVSRRPLPPSSGFSRLEERSPRGDVLVFQNSESVDLVRPADGSMIRRLPIRTPGDLRFLRHRAGDALSYVVRASFSPDGTYVATWHPDDEAVQVWDAHTGCAVTTLTGHSGEINDLAWGAEQTEHIVVTSGSDDTVRLWDIDRSRDRDC